MAVVTIIGWYGTETIGDRGILAGLISVCAETCGEKLEINLGSLFPIYSERVLDEDIAFHRECAGRQDLTIRVFDVFDCFALREKIRRSDLLMMGGGPLMDLRELYVMQFAFMFAKTHHVKSVLAGCGWGPLAASQYKKAAAKLVDLADHVIFRDAISKAQAAEYMSEDRARKIVCGCDPAVLACRMFRQTRPQKRNGGYIAVNMRDMQVTGGNRNDVLPRRILENASRCLTDIRLVPMHSFYVGGDDRYYFHHLKHNVFHDELPLKIYDDPPSLPEVMNIYRSADFCIGMRFHSILFQLVLNGAVWAFDYTDPRTGKIIGLLKWCGFSDEHAGQYRSLQRGDDLGDFGTCVPCGFELPDERIDAAKNVFISEFKTALH